jgi:hypothetical protein
VLVGLAEAAQVRHDDVVLCGEQRHELAVVAAVAGPAVQQHDRATGAGAVVHELESVDRCGARHAWKLSRRPPAAVLVLRRASGGPGDGLPVA